MIYSAIFGVSVWGVGVGIHVVVICCDWLQSGRRSNTFIMLILLYITYFQGFFSMVLNRLSLYTHKKSFCFPSYPITVVINMFRVTSWQCHSCDVGLTSVHGRVMATSFLRRRLDVGSWSF